MNTKYAQFYSLAPVVRAFITEITEESNPETDIMPTSQLADVFSRWLHHRGLPEAYKLFPPQLAYLLTRIYPDRFTLKRLSRLQIPIIQNIRLKPISEPSVDFASQFGNCLPFTLPSIDTLSHKSRIDFAVCVRILKRRAKVKTKRSIAAELAEHNLSETLEEPQRVPGNPAFAKPLYYPSGVIVVPPGAKQPDEMTYPIETGYMDTKGKKVDIPPDLDFPLD